MSLSDKQGLPQLQDWNLNKRAALKFVHVDSWNKFGATTTSNWSVVTPTDDCKEKEDGNRKLFLYLVQAEWDTVDSLDSII